VADPADRPVGPELPSLTKEDREAIADAASSNVDKAMTAFTSACGHHHAELTKHAKANAEVAALVIDIFTGFLAPSVANFAGGYLLDMFLARFPGTTEGLLLVTEMAQNKDLVKAAFTGATKSAGQVAKAYSMPIFGKTDKERFLIAAEKAFHHGAGELTTRLAFHATNGMSDEELLAVWHGYEPCYTDVEVYITALAGLLAQFDRFVGGQGVDVDQIGIWGEGEIRTERRVYKADLYGEERLILVGTIGVDGPTAMDDSVVYSFNGYVPEALRDAATARSESLFGPLATIDPAIIGDQIPPP
jgi:hypothetical protein